MLNQMFRVEHKENMEPPTKVLQELLYFANQLILFSFLFQGM